MEAENIDNLINSVDLLFSDPNVQNRIKSRIQLIEKYYETESSHVIIKHILNSYKKQDLPDCIEKYEQLIRKRANMIHSTVYYNYDEMNDKIFDYCICFRCYEYYCMGYMLKISMLPELEQITDHPDFNSFIKPAKCINFKE